MTEPWGRPTQREAFGGYDCEFVEPPASAFQTHCPVCRLILRDPYLIRCCGTSFCQTCIQRLQAEKNPCPICREDKFDVFTNMGLKRSLNQLDVYCIHRKDGCDWKGELGELDKHLNKNPLERNLGLGCQYAEISCVYQCGEKFQRHTIKAHVDSCQMKPLSCSHCHEYKSTFEDIVNNHWPECRCYPVPCPNECGIGTLQRQNLDHHLNKECPLGVSRETEPSLQLQEGTTSGTYLYHVPKLGCGLSCSSQLI